MEKIKKKLIHHFDNQKMNVLFGIKGGTEKCNESTTMDDTNCTTRVRENSTGTGTTTTYSCDDFGIGSCK